MKFTNWMFSSMWLGAAAAACAGVAFTGQIECMWAMAAPVFVTAVAILATIGEEKW